MKLLFITNVVNRLDFLEFQSYTLKRFCKNKYHFCVIDDSVDSKTSLSFQKYCLKNEISYFKKPLSKINDPASACADTIQWTYNNIILKIFSDNLIIYLDSDMFLIDDFEFDKKLLNEYIGGVKQVRGNIIYPWNGLMFLNMKKIKELDPKINFKNALIKGTLTDVGGSVYFYLKKHSIEFFKFDTVYPEYFENIYLHDFKSFKGYNLELHFNKKFLHYRAGTNWQSKNYWKKNSYNAEKDKIFEKIKRKTKSNLKPINFFYSFKIDNSKIDTKNNLLDRFSLLKKFKILLK